MMKMNATMAYEKYEGRIPLYWTEGRLLDRYHYTRILNGIKRNWD